MRPEYRRLIEMAYCWAWGVGGSADARDEFRTLLAGLGLGLGNSFLYHGHGKFTWLEEEE